MRKRVTLDGDFAVDLCTSGVVRKMMQMRDGIVSRQHRTRFIVETILTVDLIISCDVVLCQTR
jgi:hypothetical protein